MTPGWPRLPSRLTLPSGAVVQLRLGPSRESSSTSSTSSASSASSAERAPLMRRAGEPLFAEVLRAVSEARVVMTQGGAPVDVAALPLGDFHVVRAVLTRSGVLAEEEVEVSCRNCGAMIAVRPCAKLEIAPWVDDELDDAELDTTLPFGEPIEVPTIALGRVRSARTVTFEPRTVEQASALFAAGAQKRIDVTPELVRAMGIIALGGERDAAAIAEALAECDDEAFGAVGDAFLASHYVARLGCVVFCEGCGARNDVDAPYEREAGWSGSGSGRESGHGHHGHGHVREGAGVGGFPGFEAFAERAQEIAGPMMARVPGEAVELVVEGETPAVDEGGEPLLGSYVPPHPGDAGMPTRAPVVTVYYRTFRAMWNEDGPYDWDDELHETIEHELEHHIAFLRGDDPTDDEERAVIRDEAVRIVGRREAGRRAVEGFGASWHDFLARTWPLWVLAALALALTLATQR